MAKALELFHLEGYFVKHEFVAKYLLCCSDAESLSMKSLLAMADEECQVLWDDLRLGMYVATLHVFPTNLSGG